MSETNTGVAAVTEAIPIVNHAAAQSDRWLMVGLMMFLVFAGVVAILWLARRWEYSQQQNINTLTVVVANNSAAFSKFGEAFVDLRDEIRSGKREAK